MNTTVVDLWHHIRGLGAVAGLLALAACDGTPEAVTAPQSSALTRAPGSVPRSLAGTHARFYRMAQQFPGFAGVTLDSSNTVATIYLSKAENEGLVRAATQAMFREFLGANPHRFRGAIPALRVQPVRYDFIQLGEWRDQIAGIADDPDMTSWGIDETNNRVRVRVRNAAAVSPMTDRLESMGIPDSAFSIEVRGPAVFTGSLSDHYTNPVGGVSIFNPSNNDHCSMGFNAYDAQGTSIFVTASHCTTTYAGPDGSTFYQPSTSFAAIGHEINDPTGLIGTGSNGCMAGWRCRFSDAAAIQYNPGMSGRWSYLALTSSGTTTVGNQPIIGKEDQQLAFEWVSMIGATTGKVDGQVITVGTGVTDTPTHVAIEDSNEVQVGAHPGDSGGPVYVDNPPLRLGIAYLAGIEFAASSDFTVFFYSPLEDIYLELGALTVFGTTVSVSGPTFVNSPGFYTWTANALGSSGFSYQWQTSFDAANWTNAGFNSSSLTIEFKTIPGIFQAFYLRVIATGTDGGYGQTNTSDVFSVIL